MTTQRNRFFAWLTDFPTTNSKIVGGLVAFGVFVLWLMWLLTLASLVLRVDCVAVPGQEGTIGQQCITHYHARAPDEGGLWVLVTVILGFAGIAGATKYGKWREVGPDPQPPTAPSDPKPQRVRAQPVPASVAAHDYDPGA